MTYKPTASDVAVVAAPGKQPFTIHLTCNGFLAVGIRSTFERAVSDKLNAFVREHHYEFSKCLIGGELLTQSLDSAMASIAEDAQHIIRYTNVTMPTLGQWKIHIHLEEASGPCVITIKFTQ